MNFYPIKCNARTKAGTRFKNNIYLVIPFFFISFVYSVTHDADKCLEKKNKSYNIILLAHESDQSIFKKSTLNRIMYNKNCMRSFSKICETVKFLNVWKT